MRREVLHTDSAVFLVSLYRCILNAWKLTQADKQQEKVSSTAETALLLHNTRKRHSRVQSESDVVRAVAVDVPWGQSIHTRT